MRNYVLEEVIKFQNEHSKKLILEPPASEFETICGVDAAFSNNKVYAVACLFVIGEGVGLPCPYIVEEAYAVQDITYPYIPGFFALREGPALLEAIKKLKKKPNVILVDGHGIAHPRLFGIASHIGYLLQIPTIGCAKTKLVGEYEEPGEERGAWSFIRLPRLGRGEDTPPLQTKGVIGAVLRTKSRVKPIFVSPGNLIDIITSIKVVLSVSRYRIPEPLRIANIKSKKLRVES